MNVSSLSSSKSSSSTSSSYSSSGLSGLLSGMDTESMVQKMLSGTQTKIDRANQKKQQLEWKQENYRTCTSTINALYSKYFDTSYDAVVTNNLANSKFFNQMSSAVSGSGVKIVSTDTSAAAGDTSVVVRQLATNASLVAANTMSGDRTINTTGTVDLTKLNRTVGLTVNGAAVSVNLNNAATTQEVADAFNTALSGKGITAKIYDGRLRLVTSDTSATIAVDKANSTEYGLSVSGLSGANTSSITDAAGAATGTMLQGYSVDVTAGASVQVSYDGVKKTISLSNVAGSDGTITGDSVAASLNKQLKAAFGDYVTAAYAGGKFKLSMTSANNGLGHELSVYGVDANILGITPGASSSISTATKLGDISGISGSNYSFTLNGQSFSFDRSNTISDVISAVNKSAANVKISYSGLSDTFRMDATSSGAQYGISINQTEGNLLSTMFGSSAVGAAATASSGALTTGGIQGTALSDTYTTTAASLGMKVNGTNYTFSLSAKSDGAAYTKTEIETQFNDWLKTKFGTQSDGVTANISYANGKLFTAKGYEVSFAKTSVDMEDAAAVATAKTNDLALAMGFSVNGATNAGTTGATLISDVTGLAGANIVLTDTMKAADLSNIQSVDGFAVTYANGRLQLDSSKMTAAQLVNGKVDLSSSATLQALYGGQTSVTLGDGKVAASANLTAGKDAEVTINGTTVTRSSNNFTVDGITMQLTAESAKDASGNYQAATITTTQDTDTIVDALKSFVKDYNAMVTDFQKLITADATYKDYAPLTTAQQKEMSTSEIEKWTEKAKTGLLRNDDTLEGFLSTMRGALYAKSSSSNVALYDIGIATYDQTGKLSLDETALRNALSADPDGVAALFTDSTDGISKRLMKVMDDTAKVSSGLPGTLVSLAGSSDLASSLKNNTLYSQMVDLDDTLDRLQDRYENEKDRYWSMFNSMETAMNSLNTQSSMISSYFSN